MNRLLFFAAAAVLLILLPRAASAQPECVNVGVTCSLNDLGGGDYEYVFSLVNNNPSPQALFYWSIDAGGVSKKWNTISYGTPPGWQGAHPDSKLQFKNDNNASGDTTRAFSPSVAQCGATDLEFHWTFHNDGGPTPACDFDDLDYTFHVQPVNANTCANVGFSLVCPGSIPVEPTTWGLIKQRYP